MATLKDTGKAKFACTDRHVEAENPVATDPGPSNQPQNNLWDALRQKE
jgi:hypothetical protein